MKKGISLIVLVITIIVMIIIAGAIILALNSSNVTDKANWAQISADRANVQSELAVILADTIAEQDIGAAGQDYIGVTVSEVKANAKYAEWAIKVEDTNSRFAIAEPDETNPAGMMVVMVITDAEREAFGLTLVDGSTSKIKGYDWVRVGNTDATSGGSAISLSTFKGL